MLGRRWLCLGAAAALGGCGFQPVYMPTASGKTGAAARGLQTVYVGTIPDRPGQVLRQALQDRLGSDSGVPSQYDLQVGFSIPGEALRTCPTPSPPGYGSSAMPPGRCSRAMPSVPGYSPVRPGRSTASTSSTRSISPRTWKPRRRRGGSPRTSQTRSRLSLPSGSANRPSSRRGSGQDSAG